MRFRNAFLAAALLCGLPALAVVATGPILKPSKVNDVIYAWAYHDGGSGTAADPYTLTGSNPVLAAVTACPSTGCTVDLGNYVYTLGSADPAIEIPKTTSATDKRFYRIIGNGAVLNYSGTGTAIRYWQDASGCPGACVPGSSIQSNDGNELAGFSLRQTGTPRTGTGIWLNYSTLWNIHDVEIGTRKGERAVGDYGFEYGIKFAERTGSYQTVDDFITIEGCRFSGNTHAFYSGQQADNLRILSNYFEGNPNVSAAQDGVEITNANGITVQGNTFNFFKFNDSMFGLKLSADISGVQISGNYFEGDYNAIFLSTTQNQDGISITGNLCSANNIVGASGDEVFCVKAGVDGGTFKLRGLTISGNSYTSLADYEYGIRIGSDVAGACTVGPNYYTLTGGSLDFNNLFIAGSECVVMGEGSPNSSSVVQSPQIRIMHKDADFLGIVLQNTDAVNNENSPWFRWMAGGAAGKVTSAYLDSGGGLHFRNLAGTDQLAITEAGAGTFTAGVTATTFTGDLTGSVTAGSGKTVNAGAGTLRLPTNTTCPACAVGDVCYDSDATSGQQLYICTATNTWTLMGDGGGTIAFSALGGGTNTTSGAMIVGTGSSIGTTGSGTVAATSVPGSGVSGNIPGTAANVSGTVDVAHGGTNKTTIAAGSFWYGLSTGVLAELADVATGNVLLSGGVGAAPAYGKVVYGTHTSGTVSATTGGTGLTVGTSGGVNYWSSTTTQASSALLGALGIVVGGGAGAAPATSAATASIAGSISVPTAQTVDIAAHATTGGALTLKEGADDGSNTFQIKVPDAGITASKVITLVTATANIPASAIESSGTNAKCARFDASGILVADSADCGASAGDVGAVGPGCASGQCFTDTVVTSGTEVLTWEGTTSDASEVHIVAPADPTADATLTIADGAQNNTLPLGTNTLVGKSTTDIFTNKTLNVESTGNVITTVDKVWLPAAGCNNATASSFWDLPASSAPSPTCVTGTNTQKAYLDWPDVDGAYSAQISMRLPSDFTGAIDANIVWLSADNTGNVLWNLATSCVSDAETGDPAYNAASQVTDSTKGTANQYNDAAITALTLVDGSATNDCAAGDMMYLKISRDRTADTLGAQSARLVGVELTIRRAQ